MLKPPSLSDLDIVSDVGFYLCTQSTDMRKGFDALAELARQVHTRDVFCGSLFIFISRRRDRLKILYWDKDGFALWYKRLEEGTFRLPKYGGHGVSIKASELAMLLDGVDLRSLKRTKRLTSCTSAAAEP